MMTRSFVFRIWLSAAAIFAASADALLAADEPRLLFSVRRWEGEYESRDVPNGVKSTPATEAIYSIAADGTGLAQVVAIDGAICGAPSGSPDGRWVYFQSNASGEYHLYRIRPDGTEREQLTSAERPGAPWKSFFGVQVARTGQVVGVASDGQSGRVMVLSPDGKEAKLVAPHLGYLYMSALSPSGDAIICSGPASGYRLWLFGLPEAFVAGEGRVAGPTVNLAQDHPESFAPQFTPDGRTIVYFRRDGDIYRVERDGTGGRRLTEGNRYVEFRLSPQDRHGSTDGPHVSPDGKQIAFIAQCDGVPNACAIDLDGANRRQITSRKTPCGRVRWSPDGTKLAFVSFVDKLPQLFVVGAAGGEPQQLTKIDGAVVWVTWMTSP